MGRRGHDLGAPVPARILDEARNVRRLAVSALVPDHPASVFALRSVLVRDDDAELRARAAARLRAADPRGIDERCRDAVEDALADALFDPAPIVREEAARSAGALGARKAEAALRSAVRNDPSWRVRRAAVRALGRLAGDGAAADASIAAIFGALDDPFWRVRYAAIQALAARPDAVAPARPASAREAAARAYLEAVRRGERGAEAEPQEIELVHADDTGAPAAFGDADPAVVAARLGSAPPGPEGGAMLVAALASSHASLRRAAVRLLAARGAVDELRGALEWLDDPRILYAAGAVRQLLRRVHTLPLVERVLAETDAGPGARAWALAEAARLRIGVPLEFFEAAARAPEPDVRRAAIAVAAERGDVAAILDRLDDADETVRAEAVDTLGAALDDAAVRAALPGPEDGVLVARALLGAIRAAVGRAADAGAIAWIEAVFARAASSPWADVRAEAISLRARRGSIDDADRAALLADPDPWIREAAVDARAGAELLAGDPDPFVRRAAARAALAPSAERREGPVSGAPSKHAHGAAITRDADPRIGPASGAAGAPSSSRHAAAIVAARSPDAWIRTMAAGAIDARSEDGLALLLRLTRDRSPMVRAAAADALDRPGNVHDRCLRLLRSEGAGEDVRLAAHARLVAVPGPEGLAALVGDLRAEGLPAADREVLRAIALAYPDAMREGVPELRDGPAPRTEAVRPRRAAPVAPARVELRPLGKTGIAVAPLGISGAGEMPVGCYEAARDAGANLFFWEPHHRALSTFVTRAPRRHDLVIVAGTYEADARSIERDVDRALRRLRVDALGAMLLFWVRSSARLGEAAWRTLDRLKQQGKVRAIGFSTHLRDLAAEAIASRPWDVVMCRLSAAHPGAERALLPTAVARGTGVIAFSALCYGRLVSTPLGARLASRQSRTHDARRDDASDEATSAGDLANREPSTMPPITAADCYRYSLSQPGVSVCLSAPRRWRELSENLAVLSRSTLDPATIERLRAHGERVRADNLAFATLVHRA